MIVIKRGDKERDPYIRAVAVGCTGIDITYGTERQALRFASRGAATHVAKALYAYGRFYVVDVEEMRE